LMSWARRVGSISDWVTADVLLGTVGQ